VTRAEELAERVRETLSYLRDDQENYANAALSDLVADAEALAEAAKDALRALAEQPHGRTYHDIEQQMNEARDRLDLALARYRGEKP
jgi:ABC-type Zn uptake system ZnuABC Zn-binding protein ZnuA